MYKPGVYQIHIEGVITDHWSGWLENLAVQHISDKETVLTGELPDQAALLGVLSKIHTLNLKIIAVSKC